MHSCRPRPLSSRIRRIRWRCRLRRLRRLMHRAYNNSSRRRRSIAPMPTTTTQASTPIGLGPAFALGAGRQRARKGCSASCPISSTRTRGQRSRRLTIRSTSPTSVSTRARASSPACRRSGSSCCPIRVFLVWSRRRIRWRLWRSLSFIRRGEGMCGIRWDMRLRRVRLIRAGVGSTMRFRVL